MFDKILIANRGEIACRIIRTARRLGISTVAVYSEADAAAPHVDLADEAVCIGPPPSTQSYLDIERILEAVAKTGADAVHPGYGFLSENPEFAEALSARDVVFIGPRAEAIRIMGDKLESKRLAREAGVNTIPGHERPIVDAEEAVAIARRIGYPVMIKASAGGGGKGMRLARDDDEVRAGFGSAVNEARSSFGDDRVFIEKFIEQPRHIEIQVLADRHGNVVHLGERECSIQRRHQKVIEEAPSPFLDPGTRRAMGEQAAALARAVGYESAGTVEFVVDAERNFYFLEMNTRLQVEHPVTEYVTGLDLVEQMIRIAAGETLAVAQEDVRHEGWAIEARIYAEDPLRNFMPSSGRLVRYRPPEENAHLRVDSGVCEGGEIPIHYDPMIAKLITGGATREAAIERMREALDAFYIRGVAHNIPFLAAVMAHPRFAEGRFSTAFIAEEYPDGFRPSDLVHDDPSLLVAVAAAIHGRLEARMADLGRRKSAGNKYVAVIGSLDEAKEFPLEIAAVDGGFDVAVCDDTYAVHSDWRPGDPLFRGAVNGRRLCVQVERRGAAYLLSHAGSETEIRVLRPKVAALYRRMPVKAPPDTSKFLLSPMPGLLVRISVAEGDEVKAGEELVAVEAMKMENILRAERDGVIKAIHATVGDNLVVDQKIIEFE